MQDEASGTKPTPPQPTTQPTEDPTQPTTTTTTQGTDPIVTTTTGTDAPTTQPTGTQTVPPTGNIDPSTLLYGDVDLNGEVAIADTVKLSKYLISQSAFPVGNGTPETVARALAQADVTHENVVDSQDLLKIVEYNLGTLTMADLGNK